MATLDMLINISFSPFQLKSSGGYTFTYNALRVVRENVFTTFWGDRRSAPNILISITDGRSEYGYYTWLEAQKLRALGIKTFAIGIGHSISDKELLILAGDREHKFYVSSFSLLHDVQSPLQKLYCEGMLSLLATRNGRYVNKQSVTYSDLIKS